MAQEISLFTGNIALLIGIIPLTVIILWILCRNFSVNIKGKSNKNECNSIHNGIHNCRDSKYWKELNIFKGTLTDCLDKNYDLNRIKVSYPIKNEDHIIYLHDLLNENECNKLISKTNDLEYLHLEGFKGKVRSNKRRRTFDTEMSKIILNRIKKFVPQNVNIDGVNWELSRIMDYWRYCKYSPGQHFSPHYDGSKVLLSHEMSVFTINIYLNDCFIGGGTRFFMDCKENAKENDFDESGPVTDVVQPVLGGALIFNHCNKGYLHDGQKLGNNLKYIMRADLLYKCSDVDQLKQNESNGECKFWSTNNAKNEIVKNYIGRTWKCACVSRDVTVTLF